MKTGVNLRVPNWRVFPTAVTYVMRSNRVYSRQENGSGAILMHLFVYPISNLLSSVAKEG